METKVWFKDVRVVGVIIKWDQWSGGDEKKTEQHFEGTATSKQVFELFFYWWEDTQDY